MQKASSDVATKHTLHGKNIVHMTRGSNKLHFFYDAQNRPAVVVYNGTAYAYVKNLQGDIVGILDSAGNWVVEYTYDAWGAPTSRMGSMADTLGVINPFRYRSYVYDQETGLYYLRSRFYCPVNMRFLNADVIYRGNLYTYCNNCPSVFADKNGRMPMMCYFDDMGVGNIMASSMFGGGSGGFSSTTVNDVIHEYSSNASSSTGSFGYPSLVISSQEVLEALVGWVKRNWIELTIGSAAVGVAAKIFVVSCEVGQPIAGGLLAGLYFVAFNFIGSTVQGGINSMIDDDYSTNPGQYGVKSVAENLLWEILLIGIGNVETELLENAWTWFNRVVDYMYLLVVEEE